MKTLTLTGRIDKVLFQKESFFIAKLDNETKISGTALVTDIDTLHGQEVELRGRWEEHPKYGPQFVFDELKIKGSKLYFYLTKVVKGVGQKLVKRLISHYGEDDLIRIFDEEPQKLLQFKGIKEKKLSQITGSWQKYKDMRELAMFLAPYKIGESLVAEIYRTFSHNENLVETIKKNPYVITQVKGIGFKRADEMALSMGIAPDSPFRLEAAALYFIKERAEQQGCSAIEFEKLIEELSDDLGFDEKKGTLRRSVESMIDAGKLLLLEEFVAHPFYYSAEKGIYDFFKRKRDRFKEPLVDDLRGFIAEEERVSKIELGKQQREAVALANSGVEVMAIVGYAGTGKSTTAKMVLKLFEKRYGYESIMTTALSGIASQRIHDTTGYRSATIQSLLVSCKEKDQLPYDVVLLDEASMVNSQIFFQLISKLKDDATLLIIGDDGQLPPIGAGNVLADIIEHNLVPVVKLTTIYRQSEDQAIALIANSIRRGESPEIAGEYSDFRFIEVSDPKYFMAKSGSEEKRLIRQKNNEKILEAIKSEAIDFILDARGRLESKDIRGYLSKIQIITPMKGG
ncbi:MAG: AAA family ATPase, partial [Hydrogenimonas sp.]|nr:AAA family ATPase [Hydrogenimonas sp.]